MSGPGLLWLYSWTVRFGHMAADTFDRIKSHCCVLICLHAGVAYLAYKQKGLVTICKVTNIARHSPQVNVPVYSYLQSLIASITCQLGTYATEEPTVLTSVTIQRISGVYVVWT